MASVGPEQSGLDPSKFGRTRIESRFHKFARINCESESIKLNKLVTAVLFTPNSGECKSNKVLDRLGSGFACQSDHATVGGKSARRQLEALFVDLVVCLLN